MSDNQIALQKEGKLYRVVVEAKRAFEAWLGRPSKDTSRWSNLWKEPWVAAATSKLPIASQSHSQQQLALDSQPQLVSTRSQASSSPFYVVPFASRLCVYSLLSFVWTFRQLDSDLKGSSSGNNLNNSFIRNKSVLWRILFRISTKMSYATFLSSSFQPTANMSTLLRNNCTQSRKLDENSNLSKRIPLLLIFFRWAIVLLLRSQFIMYIYVIESQLCKS